MKIQIVSDLHLEFSDVNIKNQGDTDVLILAGDVLVADKLFRHNSETGQKFRDFLSRVSFQFPHVVYVAGNHEFYGGGHFYGTVDALRSWCANNYGNVYFLEDETKLIDDVMFVGGTLWTDMNKGDPLTVMHCNDRMNDYRAIKNDRKGYTAIRPIDTVERHERTKQYFRIVIDGAAEDQKIVVVGHHTPSHTSIAEHYRDEHLMNGAYHNRLEDFILDRPKIKLWVHGHTHWAFDYMIGDTRVVCNPRGYDSDKFKENTGWDPAKVFEV
jgi:Icc-related predicted phosphoesterase